jgi:hypothetical protein
MRRLSALVAVGMLVAMVVPIASASAAAPSHLRLTRSGAIVSMVEFRDGLQVNTELSASLEASADGHTGPFLWLTQAAWSPDGSGEYNTLVWTVEGQTTEFAMTVDGQLASAAVSAPTFPVYRCDAAPTCTSGVVDLQANFLAIGPTLHSHLNSVSSVSRQSLFVYHNVGTNRFATATVTLDGLVSGPSTGPADATIYDARTGMIDVTRAPAGQKARPTGGAVTYGTVETVTGRMTGESMFVNWVTESGGIGRNTALFGSSEVISTKGTVLHQAGLSYVDQLYSIDEFGYTTPISDTFSLEGGTVTTIAVDRQMAGGSLIGASIPVVSCTYIDDETLCTQSIVQATGQWAGYGATTKTRDGSSFGTAGVIVIVERSSSSHRLASAIATVDGDTFSGGIVEAWIDRRTAGFHEVHIGS